MCIVQMTASSEQRRALGMQSAGILAFLATLCLGVLAHAQPLSFSEQAVSEQAFSEQADSEQADAQGGSLESTDNENSLGESFVDEQLDADWLPQESAQQLEPLASPPLQPEALAPASLIDQPIKPMGLQARLSSSSRLTAGTQVDVTLTLAPQAAMPAGSGVAITPHWQLPILFQAVDPAAPNHLAVFSLSQAFEMEEARPLPFQHQPGRASRLHGGPDTIAEQAELRLDENLETDQLLIIKLSNLQLPISSSANYGFGISPVGDALESLPSGFVPLEVLPGPAEQLRVITQSLIRPNEDVKLLVRVEDRHGNPVLVEDESSTFPMSLSLRFNGRFVRQLNLIEPVQQISDVDIQQLGTHQLEVRSAGGGLRGLSNPIVVRNTRRGVTWVLMKEPVDLPHSLYDLPAIQQRYAGLADLILPSREMTPGTLALPYGWVLEEETRSLRQGGSIFRVRNLDEQIQVLLAENPTDFRTTARVPLLVQLAGGDGVFEWYANQAAREGLSYGFVGINHSHQQAFQGRLTRTGILHHLDESLFNALARGKTFVNQGEQILVFDDIRGPALSKPGQIGVTAYVEVIATQPIAQIELMKNGEPALTIDKSLQEDEAERLLELTLESSSKPFGHRQSLPRNPREWVGYVLVREGKLIPEVSSARTRLAASGQRLDFLTRTHGRQETVRFSITAISRDTVLEVQIAKGHESTGWLPEDRLPAPTRLEIYQIPLAELNDGPAIRISRVDDYDDKISLAWAGRKTRTSRRVTWEDPEQTRIGDYYYFRVTTMTGDMAWTSPVVVGGKSAPTPWAD